MGYGIRLPMKREASEYLSGKKKTWDTSHYGILIKLYFTLRNLLKEGYIYVQVLLLLFKLSNYRSRLLAYLPLYNVYIESFLFS